ncbi:MAG: lactate dehydrogenase [Atribacterota bacterium]|nr:lactate dehydrogenase [Atribacterota bacterium]
MIHYYRLQDKLLFSAKKIEGIAEIHAEKIMISKNESIYYLTDNNWQNNNPVSVLIHPDQILDTEVGVDITRKQNEREILYNSIPEWIKERIKKKDVGICYHKHPRWKERLGWRKPEQWNINIIGLGNVGGTLLTALKLLGGDIIKEIGIFDTNRKAVLRWEKEINQVFDSTGKRRLPDVVIIDSDKVFQADIVVFCISIGVPSPDKKVGDVRMIQLEANSKIINYYAQKARKMGFNGFFAILSDPVDLLCQSALLASNFGRKGELDGKGLSADQIRGFGLGVMNGRAAYYAMKKNRVNNYLKNGRVFGPHGEGLLVADDVENYNKEQSSFLTEKVLQANIELRELGYKPYIAPALSSGALSLLSFMKGEWHYSAAYLGGIYWGSRNRQSTLGIEWEQYNFSNDLFMKIKENYYKLKENAKILEK